MSLQVARLQKWTKLTENSVIDKVLRQCALSWCSISIFLWFVTSLEQYFFWAFPEPHGKNVNLPFAMEQQILCRWFLYCPKTNEAWASTWFLICSLLFFSALANLQCATLNFPFCFWIILKNPRFLTCDHGMAWYGMERKMERKFRYGIWKMPECNGMEDFKNGRQSSIPIAY